jgi:hypothetical protein
MSSPNSNEYEEKKDVIDAPAQDLGYRSNLEELESGDAPLGKVTGKPLLVVSK